MQGRGRGGYGRGRQSSYGGSNRDSFNRGGYNSNNNYGPPAQIIELGSFTHGCEGDLVYKSINTKIPYFNAPVFLENKSQIGKIDEILGPINQVYFTVKPQEGVVAHSFKNGDKIFISTDKLLPLEKFLPKPKATSGVSKSVKKRGSGVSKFGSRGSSRGFSGGRGSNSSRGGGNFRGSFRGNGIGSRKFGASSARGRGFGSRGRGFSSPMHRN